MPIVILGRVISGMGGAGIMAMSSIIITGTSTNASIVAQGLIIVDIVPRRDVASWRAYVNISMTLGRSAGGPVGGWFTEVIGWRW